MNTAAAHQDSAKTSLSNENPSIESLVPTDRDVCIGTDDKHFGNMLLMDLVLLHLIIRNTVQKKDSPLGKKEVDELATRLTNLFLKGKPFELSGLKDVPKPFLKGPGRILEKNDNEWKLANLTKAKAFVKDVIMSSIKSIPSDLLLEDMESFLSQKDGKDNESKTEDGNPVMQSDVIFLRADNPMEDNARSERQSGNRHFLFLASEHVSADTNESFKRVETVFKLLNSKIEIKHGTEKIQKSPRYVIQIVEEYQTSWVDMDLTDLAEFTSIFIFEIYLEKQIHGFTHPFRLTSMKSAGAKDGLKPSTVPIDDANVTVHDVLFGRGGMTNSHPGNQRFRNIIGLHRPDYMQASKPNKPRVSRRIVLAIRQGNPPGRFLKKEEDGKWYDVGDQVATEKTSQGLRERSNAEKKERSALRKAIKTHNESGDAELPSEIVRASLANISPSLSLNLLRSSKGPPKPKKKKPKGETFNDSLPPNAVDKDGNILVTSHGTNFFFMHVSFMFLYVQTSDHTF